MVLSDWSQTRLSPRRCPLRTNGRENTRLSAWVDPMVTMGLYTMMERLSKSGRSHCQNRHVTNGYLCYQCYWLPIRISPSSSTRPLLPFILSFFIALFFGSVCQVTSCTVMGYIRRINYTIPKSPGRSDSRIRIPPSSCLQIYLSTNDEMMLVN